MSNPWSDADTAHYDNMACMTPQRHTFEPQPVTPGEYCRWCSWHYSRHEAYTSECPKAGEVATDAHRP